MIDEKWTLYLHTVPKELSGYEYDKHYIGITTKNINERWGKNGNGYRKQVFYNAILKYGWENIRHEILFEKLTKEEAFSLEKEYIKKYKSNIKLYGYNIASGGHGGGSQKNIAQYNLDGYLINVYDSVIHASIEFFNTEDFKGDISRAATHNGLSHGFMWRYFENIPKDKIQSYKDSRKKEVLQYDIYGNFIREWNGVNDAINFYGSNSIINVCKGKSKISYGFQWKYKNDTKEIKDISNVVKSKRIYVYTKDGKYINDYLNIYKACEELKIKRRIDISRYLLDVRNNYYMGYRWTDKFYIELPPLIPFTNLTKPVVQIDMDNNIIEIFPSIKEAAESTTANKTVITGCCKNKKGCAYSGGYKWKYIQDIKESEISDSFILQKYIYYMEQITKRQDFKTTIIREEK